MLVSLCCFFALVWLLVNPSVHPVTVIPIAPDPGGQFRLDNSMGKFIVTGGINFDEYIPSLILFLSAIVSAAIGYALLNAAGAAGREVIPKQDYPLLSGLLEGEKEKGVDLYIRLNSLSGLTGIFTKIGITGLPLATIALTLIFASFGFHTNASPKFLDFANLTLGAFLGSYVQRHVSSTSPDRGRPPEE